MNSVPRFLTGLWLVIALLLVQALPARAADELFQLGVQQAKSGKYKIAIENLGKVIAHNPRDYRAYYFLGFCYEKTGNRKNASAMYIRAMKYGFKTRVYNRAATRLQAINPAVYTHAVAAAQGGGRQASPARTQTRSVSSSQARTQTRSQTRTGSAAHTQSRNYDNLPPEARIRYHSNPGSPHQLLSASVNGRPITVFFDTGAESCVFGEEHFKKLGIPIPKGKPVGYSAGVGEGGAQATWVARVNLKVGPIEKKNFAVSYVPRYRGEPLLGQTFFADFHYTIDAAGKTIHFIRNDRTAAKQSRGSIYAGSNANRYEVPFENQGKEIVVQVKINGRTIPMFFDTGATCVLLTMQHVKQLGITVPKRTRVARTQGVQGMSTNLVFPVRSISMGPIEHHDFDIYVDPAARIAHPLLGQSFFKNYRYAIDNVNKVIKFTRIK